jgi:glycosyltransferase involved in cell wall biosynthesis
MKILWFTWKDRKNPLTGGAETVNEELAKRLVRDGNEVIFLVAGFKNCIKEETIDNYKIIRLGNRWTVYWEAFKYYKANLVGWADLVIDEVNTIPFFAKFYVEEKNITLIYQLCREIWFYQIFFPLNLIGYLLEPIYIKLLNDKYVLTESDSTKIELKKYGFKEEKVFIFPIGIEETPITREELLSQQKTLSPTLLYFGSIRNMKRPDQVLKAFEIAKKEIDNLKFWIAGSGRGSYVDDFLKQIKKSKYGNDIIYYGKVDSEKKLKIMKEADLIIVASVKEGWGIIVTEANSQGTPAVVYDVDGLRDSCKDELTGIVLKNNSPESLAENIIKLIKDKNLYQKYRYNAWEDSQKYNYQNSYKVFKSIIDKINNKL